ncbi:MAG: molybdopterin-dependent oxidoreductase [Aeromicrobium sp.]|nr:molybdopterin-dependent oxidoreductase [Burkholderiales bacterium]
MSEADTSQSLRTAYRACNLCEAICGLTFQIDRKTIVSIRGDNDDPFSRGHICPKAIALKDIHEDPDRLRTPVVRDGTTWRPIAWDDAFDLVAQRLAAIIREHGNDAVALYAGNPNVHNFGHLLNFPPIAKLIGSRNVFSASSVDQMPQQLVSYWMFGHQFLIPIPDIDHTDYFLILGGNPIASNGSMMTVPDVAKRLKAIQTRGGKVVVVDPRRTETAEIASAHHFIRPGSDAAFLAALINTLREENRLRLPPAEQLSGLDLALDAIKPLTPERVAAFTGIAANHIRAIAREFANAKSAVAYGRMGTATQAFGATNQWLIYLLNLVTGNLDRVGGVLPTNPVLPITGPGTRAGGHGRWHSRVRRLPETNGELPVAALAEEMLTPGDGQIHALFTSAGNPALSTPNGKQLDRALAGLSFMVSVDIYVNETTRHADVILPPTSALNHDHYDSVFNALAVRNVTRLNHALWPRETNERYDWEIFAGIGTRLASALEREYRLPPSVRDVVAAATARHPQLTFAQIVSEPHGIDLGPLAPSLFARLQTADGKIQCAPPQLIADIARVEAALNAPPSALQLIGRRHVRSNNSWMHNSHRLVKGKPRHQLLMHPADLAARSLSDGQMVKVTSRIGEVNITVLASEDLMPGVVSIPHGFGHQHVGVKQSIAAACEGVSANDLTDEAAVDAVSANAVLNGVPVSVSAV